RLLSAAARAGRLLRARRLADHPHRLRPARPGGPRPRETRAVPRRRGACQRILRSMSRPRAYFFGLTIIAAVAYPVTFAPGEDSFPLSSYPMFSYRRERPTIYFARAIGADGEERRVPPELVGSSEVMQAAVTVRRAIQGGKKRMQIGRAARRGRAGNSRGDSA